jgi:hypothetical protein
MRFAKSVATAVAFVITCFGSATSQVFNGVLTQHNDNARSGQNLNETTLTPQNVSAATFGKVFSYSVDGQVYAQPLYVPNLSIPSMGTHNVVFVATENDSVYALDADGLSPTPLWHDSFINPAQGITAIPCSNTGCVVFPMRGITSTPVIDPNTDTMYLITRTVSKGQYFQTLHAIDITTGAEKFGGPVNIAGSVSGTGVGSKSGVIAFDPLAAVQRAGLLLANGMIYIAWSATREHGWIMAYDAQTLQQVAILNTTPNGTLGGVWQSGNGLAADGAGDIYVAVADGLFDVNTGGVDYGDSLLKLNSTLGVMDYFTPKDQACRRSYDKDLGSGGPLLLPAQGGAVSNELIIAGKGGGPCDSSGVTPIYVLNRDNLGQYNAMVDQVVEEVAASSAGYWSSPAYWQGSSAAYIYSAGGNGTTSDTLHMYSVSNGQLSATAVAQSSNTFIVGATPSISAKGNSSGIVWVIERQDNLDTNPGTSPAILYAYDATDVSKMLYNSTQVVQRDQGGCGNKFQVPTIANGRVYVATQNELDVFGLLGNSSSAPSVYLSNPCETFAAQAVGTTSAAQSVTLKNSGNLDLDINQITTSGLNAGDFNQSNPCAKSLAPGASCTITIKFTPSIVGAESAYVMISDNANGSPHNVYLTGVGQQVLAVTAGNNQSATVATLLPIALQVQATTGSGPAKGVQVTFSDSGVGGSFTAANVTTNSNGFASTSYTLPQKTGIYAITASASGYSSATFTESATAGTATTLSRAGGSGQKGAVGTTLAKQIIAKVVDQFGNGLPGASITFSDNGAGGKFSANPAITNSVGLAAVSYTLPTTSGTITITASTAGLTAVTYSETALAGPATSIAVLSGNNQKGSPSTKLTNPLVAKVTDQYGNPVPNVAVSFSDAGAGGSFSSNPVITGFLGKAAAYYTTPAVTGSVSITATGSGIATPANFTELVQ